MTTAHYHHFQIDNQTGSLCCDAWLGEPVDEHGRLLKAPPGHRYEEVDALATTSVAIASIASTAMKHATATSLTGATQTPCCSMANSSAAFASCVSTAEHWRTHEVPREQYAGSLRLLRRNHNLRRR
jgi:hypothetical protein